MDPVRMAAIPLLLILSAGLMKSQVMTGIDVLISNDFADLKGMRVGLVINQTAVLNDGKQRTLDAFMANRECKLVALFGPEHGIDGKTEAGKNVGDMVETRTGIPIYSLYGPTKKPTPAMLKGLDVMVYDIQDIGVRSYTYISTLICVMEACAENGVPLMVLDRPNPVNGEVVDGPVLDTAYRSFVGILPIPYVYGMTCGELALMANSQGWLHGSVRCQLTVLRMRGWRRSMTWRNTRLKWVATSPNVPTPEAAFACAVTGAIGELRIVHIGIGSPLPFQMVAPDWMNGKDFAGRMNRMKIPGIRFIPMSGKPGVRIIRDKETALPFSASVALMTSLRDAYPERRLFDSIPDDRRRMFDKVCGTNQILLAIRRGDTYDLITKSWQAKLRAFISMRELYLLYE